MKKELEATKSALKLQTVRCRQLVAAFTRKLHEKEMELRASKDLRDQQLSRLLRALLILESRLKKEQKLIRKQLEEKDLIIEKQEKEISQFKQSEMNRKWPKLDSLEPDVPSNRLETEPSLATGEERLDNLCKGLLNPSSLYLRKVDCEPNGDLVNDFNFKNLDSVKKEENTFKDNPVLESVNQILLRDEEELLIAAKPVSISINEKSIRSDHDRDPTEWYETNSNAVPDEQVIPSAWCLNMEEAEEAKMRKEVWPADKTSPIKSQHLEEKACLEMSRKNLTVVNLEEIDSKALIEDRPVSPVKSIASYEEIIPVSKSSAFKSIPNPQKPPALPPKPARLLKPHQILQQRNDESRQQSSVHQNTFPTSQSGVSHPIASKPVQVAPKKSGPSQLNQTNNRLYHSEGKSIKSTEGTNKIRPKPPDSSSKPKKNQLNSHVTSSMDLSNCVSQFGKQKKSEELVGNCGAIKIGSSVSSLITGLSRETIVTELSGETMNSTDDSHVSQLVRQFEVLGKFSVDRRENEANDMRRNFEEFKLEESYAESEENGRHDGDGAENKNVNYYSTFTIVPPPLPKDPPPETELEYKMYETFLENTGLSQKSILTPSRMLSNHRSCLKPKDVKHRNRVKAAAAIEKCNLNSSNGGSTVKYWTEPFL